MWKAQKVENYPTEMYPNKEGKTTSISDRVLRQNTIRELKDNAKTKIGENSFCISGGRLWNKGGRKPKSCKKTNQNIL